jgi:hypothetical protein
MMVDPARRSEYLKLVIGIDIVIVIENIEIEIAGPVLPEIIEYGGIDIGIIAAPDQVG